MTEDVDKLNAQAWLKEFVEEISITDPLMMSPSAPISENETALADIEDEFLRKILSLALYHQRETERNRLEANFASGEERHGLVHRAALSRYKSGALFQLFWAYVVDTMELAGSKMLGVREGWQIVEVKIERKPGMFDFFFGPPPQE